MHTALLKMASSMTLPFLRPMALPRPSTLNHFLGIAKASTVTANSTSTSISTTTPTSATDAGKPYRVLRTTTNNLPVYLLNKRGGNLKQTRLRRIEGNINILRLDLQKALGVEDKEITINQLTQQIIVKVCVMHGDQYRQLLIGLGRVIENQRSSSFWKRTNSSRLHG